MDILKDIYEKINSLSSEQIPSGIRAVLTHIDIAEKHHIQAKSTKSTHLFTDVIYRTNHAFEGILKEAYTILQGGDATKKTTYEIETFLSENTVLKERVMELFTNYRTNWRNPSTHDYGLFFTEQESFLAIVTVSAFVNILLDQIVERISYEAEKKKIEQHAKEIRKKIKGYDSLHPVDKIAAILARFSAEIESNFEKMKGLPEAQLLGMLTGFLASIEPNIGIDSSPTFGKGTQAQRPDLVVTLNAVQVVLEISYSRRGSEYDFSPSENLEVSRMKSLLQATGLSNGVVYYLPRKQDDEILTTKTTGNVERDGINIREVFAEDHRMWVEPENYPGIDGDVPVDDWEQMSSPAA